MDLEQGLHRALELLAPGMDLVVDGRDRDSRRLRREKPLRLRPIRQDERDLRRIVRIAGGLDQRAHVGAAPGNQDRDATAAHSASRPM